MNEVQAEIINQLNVPNVIWKTWNYDDTYFIHVDSGNHLDVWYDGIILYGAKIIDLLAAKRIVKKHFRLVNFI